ncbi:MAG: hypothetical protein MHMPM18_000270 [Marteilia pararefringens]
MTNGCNSKPAITDLERLKLETNEKFIWVEIEGFNVNMCVAWASEESRDLFDSIECRSVKIHDDSAGNKKSLATLAKVYEEVAKYVNHELVVLQFSNQRRIPIILSLLPCCGHMRRVMNKSSFEGFSSTLFRVQNRSNYCFKLTEMIEQKNLGKEFTYTTLVPANCCSFLSFYSSEGFPGSKTLIARAVQYNSEEESCLSVNFVGVARLVADLEQFIVGHEVYLKGPKLDDQPALTIEGFNNFTRRNFSDSQKLLHPQTFKSIGRDINRYAKFLVKRSLFLSSLALAASADQIYNGNIGTECEPGSTPIVQLSMHHGDVDCLPHAYNRSIAEYFTRIAGSFWAELRQGIKPPKFAILHAKNRKIEEKSLNTKFRDLIVQIFP